MKKRIVIALVTGLMVASLAGCGEKTDTTNQSPESSVAEADNAEETESAEEATEESTEDAATSTSAGDEEVTYTEHEFFYTRDKIDNTNVLSVDMDALHVDGLEYTLNDSVNIYTSKGAISGYTKPNIPVYVNSRSDDWYCLRFENEEVPYDYVLVKAEDFVAATGTQIEDRITVTSEEIIDEFNRYFSQEPYEIVEKSDDMQYIEASAVTISSNAESWVQQIAYDYRLDDFTQFHIEALDKTSHDLYAIWFGIYYK